MQRVSIKKQGASDIFIKIFFYIYSLIVVLPILWVFITSFKTNLEFVTKPWSIGADMQFINYVNAWVKVNFSVYTVNSVIITLSAVALTTVLGAATAYILIRVNLKFNSALMFVFLSGLYIPTALVLPSEFLLLNDLNMLNNRLVLMLLYVVFSLPYTILVLTGFYRALPKDIEEAAYIDGCSRNRTFWQIVFPLSKNGVATTIIFNLIWIWNDYLFPLTFISESAKRTLPVGLIGLQATFKLKADWVTLFAGLNMVMIPSIILYIIFQKRLSEGLIAGAVKG